MTLNWVRTKEHFWRERENNITGEILLMLKCPLGLHIKPSLLNVERCPSTAWPSLVIYKVLGGKFTFKFNPNILRLFGKCIKTSLFIKETDVATFWTSVGKFKLRLNATSTGHTVWGTFARWTVIEGEECIKERERERAFDAQKYKWKRTWRKLICQERNSGTRRGAAIAQWIHLHLPSFCPGFKSQAHHLRFYQFIFELCRAEGTKLNKKRPGLAHYLKKRHWDAINGATEIKKYSFTL